MELKEVEERLRRLEEKNKVNFFEIEKKLAEIESRVEASIPENFNERLQEIEDLILLIQLENLKMKEMHVSGAYEERPEPVKERIEPEIALQERLERLEERLAKIEERPAEQPSEEVLDKLRNAEAFVKELSSIDKRISRLEDLVEAKAVKPGSLFEDVNKILKG